MKRELITLIDDGAAAWPIVARTQRPAMPVIGFLSYAPFVAAFMQRLEETEYTGFLGTDEYRSRLDAHLDGRGTQAHSPVEASR